MDHVNNTVAVDNKVTIPKDENPARVAGNRIITALNRPNFERLLNFVSNFYTILNFKKGYGMGKACL